MGNNRWGKGEWNGAWSDKDAMWDKHPDMKKKAGWKDEDDGIFFIEWTDFLRGNLCVFLSPFLTVSRL